MDKCFIVTTLLLVYLIAVDDSLVSCQCKEDEAKENAKKSGENPDHKYTYKFPFEIQQGLEFTINTISKKTSTEQYFCNATKKNSEIIIKCNERKISSPSSCSDADPKWSVWTDCAMSNGKGIMYRYRDVKPASDETICCLARSISLVDTKECQLHAASSTTEEKNGKEVKKRYTLTEMILVALCCLLMGILLTALVFVLYMKRTLQECFSKHIKDVQGDSKQQSGPDMQFLTESGVVKKYDPNNPKSADSKNENEANESMYQSLNFDQVGNDQQTYDQFNMNEPRSDRQVHQPSSSRLRQTGNDYQIDQITNLQHTNEYCRDSDIDGHNY